MGDEIKVKIVRPDAPRDVVSQQGRSQRESRKGQVVWSSVADDEKDIGVLRWLIAHCEFHAKDGYGVREKEIAPLWLGRAERLRDILRRKYGEHERTRTLAMRRDEGGAT